MEVKKKGKMLEVIFENEDFYNAFVNLLAERKKEEKSSFPVVGVNPERKSVEVILSDNLFLEVYDSGGLHFIGYTNGVLALGIPGEIKNFEKAVWKTAEGETVVLEEKENERIYVVSPKRKTTEEVRFLLLNEIPRIDFFVFTPCL